MKYRDVFTVIIVLIFLLSFAYGFTGIDRLYWILPLVIFIIMAFFLYKLWIEK